MLKSQLLKATKRRDPDGMPLNGRIPRSDFSRNIMQQKGGTYIYVAIYLDSLISSHKISILPMDKVKGPPDMKWHILGTLNMSSSIKRRKDVLCMIG